MEAGVEPGREEAFGNVCKGMKGKKGIAGTDHGRENPGALVCEQNINYKSFWGPSVSGKGQIHSPSLWLSARGAPIVS